MKIFLTGGTGFVGRNFLEWLGYHQPDAEIICLVRDLKKVQAQQSQGPKTTQWIQGDLLEPDTYQHALQEVQAVFHAAALVSLKNGPEFYRLNTEATRKLIIALGQAEALQRLVFISSISAIDRPLDIPATTPLDETSDPHPNTDYGKSKLLAEEVVAYSGLPYTILRPAYIYGPHPRQNSSMDRLVRHIIARQPYTRIPFPGHASGLHVEDLAAMMWLAAQHPQTLSETFFVSNPTPIRIAEAFAHVANALKVPFQAKSSSPEILHRAQRLWYRQQPDNPLLRILFEDAFACNPAKWYHMTGFQPRYDYQSGIEATIQWYRSHALI